MPPKEEAVIEGRFCYRYGFSTNRDFHPYTTQELTVKIQKNEDKIIKFRMLLKKVLITNKEQNRINKEQNRINKEQNKKIKKCLNSL